MAVTIEQLVEKLEAYYESEFMSTESQVLITELMTLTDQYKVENGYSL